jgi:predicted enzyme related to lactoylglutathione lyase
MMRAGTNPVVHLELHTGDLNGARDFYSELLGWRMHPITTNGAPYLALDLPGEIGGGMVECRTERPLWLPYIEVPSIGEATDRARLFGASVLLGPREGPAGWRSVVAAPAAGEIAFWQPKR